jgi:hypothetical protein
MYENKRKTTEVGGPSTSAFYTIVMFAMNGPVQEVRGKVNHDRKLSELLQDLACGDGRVVGSATACHTVNIMEVPPPNTPRVPQLATP